MSTPFFVVGTGRCGSTLVSSILNEHPDVLSVSEFFTYVVDFGGQIPRSFAEGEYTGQQFWDIISPAMPRVNKLAAHDVPCPEYLYPFKKPGMRFNTETGIPNIAMIFLPHLSDDPDALYAELDQVVPKQPTGTMHWHYEQLFQYLMDKFGNKVWVERSGGSLVYLAELVKTFPDAKFIHLVRDGRNVAPSMQKHTGFRMFMICSQLTEALGFDPYETDDRTGVENLPPELAAFLPENFTREAFLSAAPPLEAMGGLWSQMVSGGVAALSQFPSERVLTLGYEDLCLNSREKLNELLGFVGVDVDPAWIDNMADSIMMSPNSWKTLPADEQAKLNAACAPGMEAIGRSL